MMHTPSHWERLSRSIWLVRLLLTIHALLLLNIAWRYAATVDESAHIPSALGHWQTGNYSAYRVNPHLPRMLATIPTLAASPNLLSESAAIQGHPRQRIEWGLANAFAEKNRDRYHQLVFLSRLMGIVLSCLGGWLLWRWGCEVYGNSAGLFALVVWCFEPNILGHGSLITPDMPSAVATLGVMYFLRRYLDAPTWRNCCWFGLLSGIALLTKFTLFVLIPVWSVLFLCLASLHARSQTRTILLRLAHLAFASFLSLLVIDIAYEFTGVGKPLKEVPFISERFTGRQTFDESNPAAIAAPGNRFADSWLGNLPLPIPEDMIIGIDVQKFDFETYPVRRQSYLAGEWRPAGWWYFYLYALGVKCPTGFVLLWAAGIVLAFLPPFRKSREELVIYLPALAIMGFVSSQTGFTHHLRYVLPVIPLLILGSSKVMALAQPRYRFIRLVAVLLAGWGVVSSCWVYPRSLSYFNELAGGPIHGHDHLMESNVDWGQDLIGLGQWIQEHPEARPLGTALYSLIPEASYGIKFVPIPALPASGLSKDTGPQPGWYAVSVCGLRGQWLPKYERQALTWFQHFRPVDRIGYSIFIYHLDRDEVNQVRARLGLEALSSQ